MAATCGHETGQEIPRDLRTRKVEAIQQAVRESSDLEVKKLCATLGVSFSEFSLSIWKRSRNFESKKERFNP